jgi:S1-C subfamily serine protease
VVEINATGPIYDSDKGQIVKDPVGATAVVIDAREGLVLTNAHVVQGQTSIKAMLSDGTEVDGHVEGQAPCEDLAVVRLRPVPDGLQNAKLGDSKAIKIGDKVVAVGFPGAFEEDIQHRKYQATDGTVSAEVGPATLDQLSPKLAEMIQHQAPLNPGMSGGPLLNEKGEVVGLNTLGIVGETTQNQNGAIAISRIKSLLSDLKAGENTGYVGWGDWLTFPWGDRDALVVGSVAASTPAAQNGIKVADVILAVDGTPVETVSDLCDILGSKASGDTLEVDRLSFLRLGRYPTTEQVETALRNGEVREKLLKKKVSVKLD